MKVVPNASFLYSDFNKSSRHKTRFKVQNKKKFFSFAERRYNKAFLLAYWHLENVPGWAIKYWSINSRRFSKIKTIKPSCLYSNRSRSVNSYLAMSKYKIAHFSRDGLIKDFKKY